MGPMNLPRLCFFLLLGLLPAALPAQAQTTLGSFGEWAAFTRTEGNAKVCYMGSSPQKMLPAEVRRGDVYVLVTHRPTEKSLGIISIEAGYSFKPESQVEVTVSGMGVFKLYTSGGQAWAYSNEDPKLVAAMKAGGSMVVKGTSSRGTVTTDTYSLVGFTAAYQAIDKACGVTK